MKLLHRYAPAAMLGAAAGLRSLLSPAILAQAATRGSQNGPLGFLGSRKVAKVLGILATGELITDKLPFTPDRIAPGPVIARAVSGGLCGSAICKAPNAPAISGAVVGAVAAIAAAQVGYSLRRRAVHEAKLPDFSVALVEDAVAIGIALAGICSSKLLKGCGTVRDQVC